MARFQRFIHGLASSYTTLVIGILYNLISVPLALHYLGRQEFGLWALVMQLVGYIALIDLGLAAATSRLVIDYKDHVEDGRYGSLIKTSWVASSVQGVVVVAIAWLLVPPFVHLLEVPPSLIGKLIRLIRWQGVISGGIFATRIFSQLLYAHQRIAVNNYIQGGGLMVGLGALWLGFKFGLGLDSVILASFVAAAFAVVCSASACVWLKLLPSGPAWGRLSWRIFQDTASYGKDLSLMVVGTQLIRASQTVIVTRFLGLEAAAVWSVGTKSFLMLCQLLWRVFDMSTPAYAEMVVRGEKGRLRHRYQAMFILTASLSGVVAVMLALCNSDFVTVWTHGKIVWPFWNNILLGLALMIQSQSHCYTGLVLIVKDLRIIRFVYLFEGLTFVTLASLSARAGGMTWVIVASVVCGVAFSWAYGWRYSARYFEVAAREIGWKWNAPLLKILGGMIPLALALAALTAFFPVLVRLGVTAVIGGTVGGLLFLRIGLPPDLQQEILERTPQWLRRILQRLLPRPPVAVEL